MDPKSIIQWNPIIIINKYEFEKSFHTKNRDIVKNSPIVKLFISQ